MKICIIGGGVIGLCTAYHASKRGYEVTVISRDSELTEGCSVGNAGMIVPSHFIPLASPGMPSLGLKMLLDPKSPFSIQFLNPAVMGWAFQFWRNCTPKNVQENASKLLEMNLASKEEFKKMSAEFGPFGFTERGLLMLCKTKNALTHESKVAKEASELGLKIRVLDREETNNLDPNIEMDILGSVYFQDDCHLVPQTFFDQLKKALQSDGVRLIFDEKIDGFTTESDQIKSANSAQNQHEADYFVLSAGSWTPEVAKLLGIKIPIVPGKGYSMTVPSPPQMPSIPSILVESRVAITPMNGALRIAGTMEIGGLDLKINPNRVQGIRESVPKYFPKITSKELESLPIWTGLRPCTPNGVPIMEKSPRYSNLLIGAGHAMMGLSLGPITGKKLIEMIEI